MKRIRDMNNPIAERYATVKSFDELEPQQQLEFGRVMAKALAEWATNPDFEPWEFSSEELPWLIDRGIDAGLLRERHHHTETLEKIVFDD